VELLPVRQWIPVPLASLFRWVGPPLARLVIQVPLVLLFPLEAPPQVKQPLQVLLLLLVLPPFRVPLPA
jgi:hypothetical protein